MVHKQSSIGTQMCLFIYILSVAVFCAAASELSSCDRDRMAAKLTVLTNWLFTENVC